MEDKKNEIGFIEYTLYFFAGFNLLSSFIYQIFEEELSDKWFSRTCLAMICFGFAGVIRAIRKK